jgi:multidrug resistance efflux pump
MLDGPRSASIKPSPTPTADALLREREAGLLRAEQSAVDGEQLLKEGILARVEFEARVLRLTQAREEFANAQLAVAAAHTDAAKKSFDTHKASQSDLDSANAALKSAQDAAASASAEWDAAQLQDAVRDFERKRKLFTQGVGSRQDLQMAQDRVTLLTGSAPQ